MSLNETNVNAYNLRRAKSFAAAGINDGDLRYAMPSFVGYGCGDCSLCGKKNIHWLFGLHFSKPDLIGMIAAIEREITRTDEVTFNPVGSECIKDWADAMPESKEKLEFLIRWQKELKKLARAKAEKATESALQKAGFVSVTAFCALVQGFSKEIVTAALPSYYERRGMFKLAIKLAKNRRLSPNALQGLLIAVKKVQDYLAGNPAPTTPAPITPPPPAAPAIPTDPLLVRAQAVLADPVKLARLSSYDVSIVTDITTKVMKYKGKFASGSQRSYLESLVTKAEKAPVATTAVVAKPTHPLIDRANAVIADAAMFGVLGSHEQNTVKDIVAKVTKYGSFRSASQEQFLLSLVTKAENKGVKAGKLPVGLSPSDLDDAVAPEPPAPGAADFVSASGIAGARY